MTQLDWLFLYKQLQTRKFKGHLNLKRTKIPSWFRIPDNLKVLRRIDLSYTNISKLPKNLQCDSLWLDNCKNIKQLSEDLKVKYTINLSGSSIERLPENLQCKSLWLENCQNIKKLPEGLNVEDTISLTGSSIERLPKNLQCNTLYLNNCINLKKLPEGLKANYLDIYNSSITKEYCEKMKQKGKISYNNLCK